MERVASPSYGIWRGVWKIVDPILSLGHLDVSRDHSME